MKSVIKVPLNDKSKVLFDVGANVSAGKTVAVSAAEFGGTEIDLSEILKVKPTQIFRYIKKKPGESIARGEILAQKKSFLTSLTVKSPVHGRVKEVDLKKGVMLIDPGEEGRAGKIILHLPGKIKSIGKSYLEIEVEGEIIKGESGEGAEASGEIHTVGDDDIFGISDEVEGKIVLIRKSSSDLTAKLDTLGAAGLISIRFDGRPDLGHIQLSEEKFKEAAGHKGQTAWIRPASRELIIA